VCAPVLSQQCVPARGRFALEMVIVHVHVQQYAHDNESVEVEKATVRVLSPGSRSLLHEVAPVVVVERMNEVARALAQPLWNGKSLGLAAAMGIFVERFFPCVRS
jgi:hypothetical protein